MKLGIGLYRHMLTPANYRFARQIGCSHVVIHLVDYFKKPDPSAADNQPVDSASGGWGIAGDPNALWTTEELLAIRKQIEAEGLRLEAIENFDPAHWHDVLLDGPKRDTHMENVKRIVRSVGAAGIPVMGYNFSIAGVAGRVTGPFARGNAESVGVEGVDQTPVPSGMVWNMVYDQHAPPGTVGTISHEELWRRLARFLDELVPVAEEAGVILAAHPDDPPAATVRGTPRLVYQPAMYQRLLDLRPSHSNALEFCVGTIAEMTEGDVYEATETYSSRGKLAYVHLRNVRGKIPRYHEVFIDEGDIDIPRIIRILKRNGYSGVLIPDHTPLLECAASWHAGMAYAVGYMRALLQALDA
ncbi:MAG TPA: mannonate dehydratase [Spirochaetia bacterium]|nr:mannonate dehydratase [Spirochaetia bacterium]